MRVVAIDGPAASGKSSTAKAVARALGFHHLDSGALYRTLTRVALDAGLDPDNLDVPALLAKADRRGLGLRPEGEDFVPLLDGAPAEHLIRTPAVTAAVSAVSAVPEVRDWANARMRALAEAGVPIVVDGRDIGSVVFPEAGLKIFLYAKSIVRAMRRLAQQGGKEPTNEEIFAEAERLKARDKADASRPVAPLVSPPDAVELDSSRMTFDEQVNGIAELARAVYGLPQPSVGGGGADGSQLANPIGRCRISRPSVISRFIRFLPRRYFMLNRHAMAVRRRPRSLAGRGRSHRIVGRGEPVRRTRPRTDCEPPATSTQRP